MKVVKFEKGVNFNVVVEMYGEFEYKGMGVYRFEDGEVVKVSDNNEVKVREVEDILEEIESGKLKVGNYDWGMEKVEEFVMSEMVEWYNEELGCDVYVEEWDEEKSCDYVMVL